MNIKSKYAWFKHIDFMLLDLIVLICSFVFAYRFKFGDFGFINNEYWTLLLAIISLINVVICLIWNPYSGVFKRSYYDEVIRALSLLFMNFAISSLMIYILKMGVLFSREMLVLMYLSYFAVSLMIKIVWKKILVHFHVNRTTAIGIICDSEHYEATISSLNNNDFNSYSAGVTYIMSDADNIAVEKGLKVNSEKEFIDAVFRENIREVLVAVNPENIEKETLKVLINNDIAVHFLIRELLGFQSEQQSISNVGYSKTLAIGIHTFSPRQVIYLGFKRFFDFVFGLVGLIVLIPVSVILRILFWMTGDTGKLFYTQKRVGLNGKIIEIYKFRSMCVDSDKILIELLKDEKYRKEWEENQKFENDPRITKIGKFIRKTSIDELPQFINILNGTMSLIGPRPLVEGELEAHNGLKLYQHVKPGITGWWGCNGRSDTDYNERLKLEYYYVVNCSFLLDCICIARTIKTVIFREGAK